MKLQSFFPHRVVEVYIVRNDGKMTVGLAQGNRQAWQFAEIISKTLLRMSRRARKRRGKPYLCLTCEHEFTDPKAAPPEAFVLILPFAEADPARALCSPVCLACSRKTDDDLAIKAEQFFKAIPLPQPSMQ